jgi:hypothetical protein
MDRLVDLPCAPKELIGRRIGEVLDLGGRLIDPRDDRFDVSKIFPYSSKNECRVDLGELLDRQEAVKKSDFAEIGFVEERLRDLPARNVPSSARKRFSFSQIDLSQLGLVHFPSEKSV